MLHPFLLPTLSPPDVADVAGRAELHGRSLQLPVTLACEELQRQLVKYLARLEKNCTRHEPGR